MIDVQNRTPLPGKAGRVKLTLDDSTILGGILEMADEATQDGTPWDRDTARKLQADIRTYPAAAGQSITAGDVVDLTNEMTLRVDKRAGGTTTQFLTIPGKTFNWFLPCALSDTKMVIAYQPGGGTTIGAATFDITGEAPVLVHDIQVVNSTNVNMRDIIRLSDSSFAIFYTIDNVAYGVIGSDGVSNITLGNPVYINTGTYQSSIPLVNACYLAEGSIAIFSGSYYSSTMQEGLYWFEYSGTTLSKKAELNGVFAFVGPAIARVSDSSALFVANSKVYLASFSSNTITLLSNVSISNQYNARIVVDGDYAIIISGTSGSDSTSYATVIHINGTSLTSSSTNISSIWPVTTIYYDLVKHENDFVAVYARQSNLYSVVLTRNNMSITIGEPVVLSSADMQTVRVSNFQNKIIATFSKTSKGSCAYLIKAGSQYAGTAPFSSSQAISLTTATEGQPCEVIYSGVTALAGVIEGQKITSDGVYGVGVLAGVLQVWSKDRPGLVVTGSFTTSAQLTTIDLGFTPMVVIIYGAENNERIATGEATTAKIAQIPKVLTSWYADSTFGKIVQNGFSHWAASGGQGLTFFYIALQGG